VKRDIEDLTYGLDAVAALRPVTFRWRYLPDSERRPGLVAQETAAIIPEVVVTPVDEQDSLGLRYSELIPVLINAIQEQQAIIDLQEARIVALERLASAP
jgi:hypothetical protein